jgi:Ca2+:H+ antiporter
MSSFIFVATGALILPAAFDAGLPNNTSTQAGVLALSRGAAIVLLIIYTYFLLYQLKTYSHVFETGALYGDPEGDTHAAVAKLWASASTVLIVTVAVSICSDYLVGSIDDVVESFGVSKVFIGLVGSFSWKCWYFHALA